MDQKYTKSNNQTTNYICYIFTNLWDSKDNSMRLSYFSWHDTGLIYLASQQNILIYRACIV